MSPVSPVHVSRALGAGRIAFALTLAAVPQRVGPLWLGEGGRTAPTAVALRGLAVREAVIGMAQAHSAHDPARGYRWARTSAFGDVVDLIATVGTARLLPRRSVVATVAFATASAAASLATSAWLRRTA